MDVPSEQTSDPLFLVEFHDGVLIIVPLDDVDSFRWHELEQASKGIFEAIRTDPRARILVDMGRLRYCGSAFLGLMVRVWRSVSPQSGILSFCSVHEEVAEILKMTRLDTLWDIYPTRAAAITALQLGKQ